MEDKLLNGFIHANIHSSIRTYQKNNKWHGHICRCSNRCYCIAVSFISDSVYVFQLNDNKIDASIKVHQASITVAGSWSSAQQVRKWACWSVEFGLKYLPGGDWGSLVTYLQKDRLAKSILILWRLHWIDWNPKKSWETNKHTHTEILWKYPKAAKSNHKNNCKVQLVHLIGKKIPCKLLIWFNV